MKKSYFLFAVLFLSFSCYRIQAQDITTIAGNDTLGFRGDGGPATASEIGSIDHIATDFSGNLYLADDNRIRKINHSGIISTITGNGTAGFSGDGGPATAAEVSSPWGICCDHSGNIYFCDIGNERIRKIDAAGNISTIGGDGVSSYTGDGIPATNAAMSVLGIAIDTAGNIYFADPTNARIREINTSGIVSTVAGNGTSGFLGDGGPATAANIFEPHDLVIDSHGNIIFGDFNNMRIREINTDGIINTIAGTGTAGYAGDGGPATAAEINYLFGLAIDTADNLLIAHTYNNRIRKRDTNGVISTICGIGSPGFSGDGGPATAAQLDDPQSVAIDPSGNIYIADFLNYRIREIKAPMIATNTPAIQGTRSDLKIFPDPSPNNQFSILIPSGNDEQIQISICNLTGEKVIEVNSSTNKILNIQLNAPPGIYFVNALSGSEKWYGKIVLGE